MLAGETIFFEKQAMRAAKWYAENNEYATSWILCF